MARKAAMRSGAHSDGTTCWLVIISVLHERSLSSRPLAPAVSPVRTGRHIAVFPWPAVFHRCVLALGNGTGFAVHQGCSCERSSASHQKAQRSQDALTPLVIPRSALPLLHG